MMIIIIPCYNPTSLFIDTIKDLDQFPELKHINRLVVDDGSTQNTDLFEDIKRRQDVTFLRHESNQGKGAALKTAFQYLLTSGSEIDFAVTVDADYQHRAKDVVKLVQAISKDYKPDHFFIGVRDFNIKNTVGKSYLGNKLSQFIFNLRFGTSLRDNQSGLRGYSKKLFSRLLDSRSNRYDFEIAAIIYVVKNQFQIQQVPIETYYYEKNASSHFRPIKDTIEIVKVMIKS
jgi:glycosyltransferase involved in cell wall biosynthesis